jgi:hypothetical protein
MEQIFILVLVGLTSAGAYIIGRRRFGLSLSGFRHAISGVLEGIGMTLAFFAINLGAGMIIILAGRLLLREFVSLYLVNDLTLLVLSLFQGLAFQRWWQP